MNAIGIVVLFLLTNSTNFLLSPRMCVKLIRRKLTTKTQKHCNVQTIAESKLNSIKDIVSKALQDGEISEGEFKMVLNEMEKYSELKQEIKTTKNIEITDEEKKN